MFAAGAKEAPILKQAGCSTSLLEPRVPFYDAVQPLRRWCDAGPTQCRLLQASVRPCDSSTTDQCGKYSSGHSVAVHTACCHAGVLIKVERMDLNQMLDSTTFPDWEAPGPRHTTAAVHICSLKSSPPQPKSNCRPIRRGVAEWPRDADDVSIGCSGGNFAGKVVHMWWTGQGF